MAPGEVMARQRGYPLYPPLAGYPMSYLLSSGRPHSICRIRWVFSDTSGCFFAFGSRAES